ncbi:MAG: energy transducer TonB [Calditrichaceae bacterium]
MKRSLLLSMLIHLVMVSGLILLSAKSYIFPDFTPVYAVQLFSPEEITVKDKTSPKNNTAAELNRREVKQEQQVNIDKKEKVKKTKTESNQASASRENSPVKVNTKDFPFNYYLNLIQYRLQENWKPPVQAGENEDKLHAVVGFRVLRNGNIENVNIENTSGRFMYDQAAKRAVYAVVPLPPLPEEFRGDQLLVHIDFEAIW